MFALGKHYLPILAEAFADDVRDVLDDNLKIKQEYAQAIGKIPPAEREKLVF
jgi:hypothetical protein